MTEHYLTRHTAAPTPQSEPLNEKQVPNSAGGYSWAVDDWTRLLRFLILGTEGGTYYISERKLTLENAGAVQRCIKADGTRVVDTIARVSTSGRAHKNDPALFTLALVTVYGDEAARRAAYSAVPRIARTGTHLFQFFAFRRALKRKMSHGMRRAIRDWILWKGDDQLALQLVKYRQREGWTFADLLRLAKIPGNQYAERGLISPAKNALLARTVGKPSYESVRAVREDGVTKVVRVGEYDNFELLPAVYQGYLKVQEPGLKPSQIANLVSAYRLPREALPTEALRHPEVWDALLQDMPMFAMIRNLGVMTSVGLLSPGSAAAQMVASRLRDAEWIQKARVHPIAVLAALLTYRQGRGFRGSKEWTPVTAVVDALDAAFYASFGAVEPTGKRLVLALDVSSSMDMGRVGGVEGLTPRVAAAAMALITAAVEPQAMLMAFSHQLVPLSVSPRQRLDDVVSIMQRLDFGGTDCALPMLWALGMDRTGQGDWDLRGRKYTPAGRALVEADAFVIYTDSETWAGGVHPAEALRRYRDTSGIHAKLVVVGMTSNGFSIADPDDAGMLDVVGFDTATPNLIGEFVRGRI